jgi:hypothetical protein
MAILDWLKGHIKLVDGCDCLAYKESWQAAKARVVELEKNSNKQVDEIVRLMKNNNYLEEAEKCRRQQRDSLIEDLAKVRKEQLLMIQVYEGLLKQKNGRRKPL